MHADNMVKAEHVYRKLLTQYKGVTDSGKGETLEISDDTFSSLN